MAYLSYSEYINYGGALSETEFNGLYYDAQRYVDFQTTGIDNVKKLKVAFPTDEDDAEAVKRCLMRVIDLLNEIENANSAMGFVTDSNGLVHGAVSSVSSGSESISYSNGSGLVGMAQRAAADSAEKSKLISTEIKHYLSGITDANGINLLYMGRYPRCIKTP